LPRGASTGSARVQGQLPPEGTCFNTESVAHFSSQFAPVAQLNEHEPVQLIWHVAPPEQSTLALGPTVMSHDAVPAHLRLHDEPHEPAQSVLFSQSSVQLAEPQLLLLMSHVFPEGQVQVDPVQLGGVPLLLPPQPNAMRTTLAKTIKEQRICRIVCRPLCRMR
jgi:hypothetical protein